MLVRIHWRFATLALSLNYFFKRLLFVKVHWWLVFSVRWLSVVSLLWMSLVILRCWLLVKNLRWMMHAWLWVLRCIVLRYGLAVVILLLLRFLFWNTGLHVYNCWNFTLSFWASHFFMLAFVINLFLSLLRRIINIFRWSHIVLVWIRMWVIIIGMSLRLSWAVLWVTTFKLFCHGFVNSFCDSVITIDFGVVLTHQKVIIHIFLDTSGW